VIVAHRTTVAFSVRRTRFQESFSKLPPCYKKVPDTSFRHPIPLVPCFGIVGVLFP
jgi:hypothetical protein